MKRFYFTFLALVLCFTVSAQTTLLETSFEGPGFDEGWTIGVSQGIEIEPEDYPPGLEFWEKWSITESTSFGYVHSGDSAAWIGGTAYQEATHDWLMTPKITVPEDGDTQIHYWLWYHSEAVYVTRFYIMIYDFENSVWEEAYLLANDFNSPFHYIEEYKLDITAWAGKDIMIAFVKNGTYQMAMDDIKVVSTGGTTGVEEFDKQSGLCVYPNPASDMLKVEVEAIPDDNKLVISDIAGRIVMSSTITELVTDINVSDLESGVYFVRVGDSYNKLVIR